MHTTEIVAYNTIQNETAKEICTLLCRTISTFLVNADAKLYHGSPVWFLDGNPIVGYDAVEDRVNILFWSGQSFRQPGLLAKGKFKAAAFYYDEISQIDQTILIVWLKESIETQWNYRDLRAHNGVLSPIVKR